MAKIWADRVAETSTTTGTGDFTLAGAVTGFRAFSAVCATSDTVEYMIEAVDGSGVPTGEWEIGLGTYSAANTLTRTTVRSSSNAGAAVNFSAGTKHVALMLPAAIAAAVVTGGTSFPGSPASGDRFKRTDINVDCFYDGTRWLSEQLFSQGLHSVNGTILSSPWDYTMPHPFRHKALSIYIEDFQHLTILTNGTTASNYFAYRLSTFEATGSTVTGLGAGLTSQSQTQNVWTSTSEAINAVVAPTVEMIYVSVTETGAATAFMSFAFNYRLVVT